MNSISTKNNDVFNRQQSNYDSEILIVVWLQTISTTNYKYFDLIKSKIENNVDLLRNFIDNPNECINYIEKCSKNVKIFLILSNKYTQILLDNLHESQLIVSIYIHDEIPTDEDLSKYSKVINIHKDLHQLTDDLSSLIYQYIRYAQLPITIFKQRIDQDQTTNLLNKFAYFVDFCNPLLIDLLFNLPQIDYEQEKAKFLEQCRIYYRANKSMLKTIDEFEKTYKPEFSILWYKRDTFVYRLLNKVMRQNNIEGIFIFHFFILDLYKQINKIYNEFIDANIYTDNTSDEIYRGQLMFINEINKLKENLINGTIISINSFFSTTRTRDIALDFVGITTDTNYPMEILHSNKKYVLFEIKIHYDHKMKFKQKPFADVSHLSDRNKLYEQEIIFMVGSFFQIDEILDDIEIGIRKTKITLIKLTLINENNLNISIMNDYQILKSTKTFEGKLIRIGNLLIDYSLSYSNSADIYYQILYNQSTVACLTGQAWIALKRQQYDLARKLALDALSINDQSNDELTITILNCLGGIYSKQKNYSQALKYYTQAYDLSKPTDEKIVNGSYKGPCIPIDKYAMYDNYRNISSINKACIYQKNDDPQLAWNMYKEIVDCEMRDTTDFHCHTCMTIAESGTHDLITDPREQIRIWNNWKRFLEYGLVDILKYRTSAITGYLSLTHQYDFSSRRYNNNYCREMAIDYFHKVEKYCEPYISNYQYYLYTLQCYERLAELYQYWDNRSIDYYGKIIKLCLKCHPDDLENIIIGYKGMLNTYKQQQQLKKLNNSEDISSLLCTDNDNHIEFTLMTPPVTPLTPPVTPLIPLMFGTLFQNIKSLHFAFGFYDKWIDSRLKTEVDLRKKIIYCHMKLAALYNDQNKINDAENSLKEARLLCRQFESEMQDIIIICEENLSYNNNNNFDFIIKSYEKRLSSINNIFNKYCIDENQYCYIAKLYEKKNDFNSALKYLQIPIKNFEKYDYICLHTIDCYIQLAKYYQRIQNDKNLTINTYQRIINLLKKHRNNPIISIIEEHLINYFTKINDFDTIIIIYEELCRIIRDDRTDILILYNHLKQILKLLIHKSNAFNAIMNVYNAFLNFSLEIINPLTSQMNMILIHFRNHSIEVYKKSDKFSLAIKIYQKLLTILFEYQTDTMKIINTYKLISSEFIENNFLEDSIISYENLLNFVCHHHSTGGFIEGDLISFIFFVWKDRIIKSYLMTKKFGSAIHLHLKMIHFLENYRLYFNPHYNLNEFILKILENYDEIVMIYQFETNHLNEIMNIYQEQIEFLIKFKIENVQKQINKIFLKCQQFALDHQEEEALELYSKLLIFIEKNRLNYLSDLFIIYKELENQSFEMNNYLPSSYRLTHLSQSIFDYKQKANDYLINNQLNKAIKVYKNEILPFLLENHAHDDEQISICYQQIALLYYKAKQILQALNYYQLAINIYENQRNDFYTEYAFELNPNICRRYAGTLFKCYNSMKIIHIELNNEIEIIKCEQNIIMIYEKYKDQFHYIVNPETIEIRPFIELNY